MACRSRTVVLLVALTAWLTATGCNVGFDTVPIHDAAADSTDVSRDTPTEVSDGTSTMDTSDATARDMADTSSETTTDTAWDSSPDVADSDTAPADAPADTEPVCIGDVCSCTGAEADGAVCLGATQETWRRQGNWYFYLYGGIGSGERVHWNTFDIQAHCAGIGGEPPHRLDDALFWLNGVALPVDGGLPVNGTWTGDVSDLAGSRAWMCSTPKASAEPGQNGEICENSEPFSASYFLACRRLAWP